MKTQLTNSYLEFIKHVQDELSRSFSPESQLTFSTFPALSPGHFSIQVIGGSDPFLVVRQWSQNLADSYQLGIYHLNSIHIKEKRMTICGKDFLKLRELSQGEIEVKDLAHIILDGVEFELRVQRHGTTSTRRWHMEYQISGKTKELIDMLVDIAGLQQSYEQYKG